MKRIFSFMIAAAMVVTLGVSCDNNDGKEGKEEGKEESRFAIDGDVADWSEFNQEYVVSLECAADHPFPAVRTAKLYADKDYLYVYLTFNDNGTAGKELHMDIYADFDNDATTGGYDNEFIDYTSEYSFQGTIRGVDGKYASYSGGLYEWIGDNAPSYQDEQGNWFNNWAWSSLLFDVSYSAEGAGKAVSDGVVAYELKLPVGTMVEDGWIENFNTTEIGIGVDILSGWDSIGWLPNTAATEENPRGKTPKAKVKIAPSK